MTTLTDIRNATLSARARTGDKSIGTRIDRGLIQVVRVTYEKSGRSKVAPVSEFMSADAAVAFLEKLQ